MGAGAEGWEQRQNLKPPHWSTLPAGERPAISAEQLITPGAPLVNPAGWGAPGDLSRAADYTRQKHTVSIYGPRA